MTLYKAEKDGKGFYIQPDMLNAFASQGYTITKYEEVAVDDVKAEEEAALASGEYSGSNSAQVQISAIN